MNALAQQISQMSPLKVALATQQLASKMAFMNAEPIAVIGIGCRFPGGANNPDLYWQLLKEGRDAVVEMSKERWDVDAYYDPDPEAPGKMSVRHGGFLDQVDKFDAQFFGISPREAAVLDPQQRLLLEVSWEALENAGIVPSSLHNSPTGVYIGITTSEYEKLCLQSDISLQTDNTHVAYMGTGNDTCAAAGRLSYSLGLTGPSLSVNTACSSSLVATHLACESLRHRTSNLAIAGGVNLTLIPDIYVVFSKAGMLSPEGRCKTFDAAANGYVRGEGCGILILKRLSDAVADGDNVLAIIRGSAVNQDGRSSGLTVPNGPSQQAVIRQALDNSGVTPAQVSYVEAHGTGTSLGDPIEVGALGAVFREGREHPLLLGSAKTNIGHLESGAGAAGLIKTILSLQHGEIPPNLHFKNPSPHIAWDTLPIKVVTETTPWPMSRRIAGVSSFGYSGTNAHFVLEAAPTLERKAASTVDRPRHLLTLSARTKEGLAALASDYRAHLASENSASLADTCWTANTRRTLFSHRLAVAADNKQELHDQLSAFGSGSPNTIFINSGSDSGASKIAFLFTGQGAQYTGMARELYDTQPTFRNALDRCNTLLQPYLKQPLLDILYPDLSSAPVPVDLINETAYTQPALFAVEYALASLWQSWGIQPDVMIGHSVGEYAAACIAGVFSLEDGLRLIAARGRLMQALPHNGAMMAIRADEHRVADVIRPYADRVSLATINGPHSVVIAGEIQAIETIAEQFATDGIETKRLTVSHAFHSPLMDPMLAAFEEIANTITYNTPTIGIISNINGQLVTDELCKPSYWVRHVREAVRFNVGMSTLETLGCNVFLEIGPQPTLLGMGRHCVDMENALWLPSLRSNRSDWQQLLESVSELFVRGVAIDWQGLDQDYVRHTTVLPTYPFQRQRHWLPETAGKKRNQSVLKPLVDKMMQSSLVKETVLETAFSTTSLPFLIDHQVFDEVVVPGACHLSMVLSGVELMARESCQLEDVIFPAPLILPEGQTRSVQVVFTPDDSENSDEIAPLSFQLISTAEGDSIAHATGHITKTQRADIAPVSLTSLQARCEDILDPNSVYDTAAEQYIVFGPSFRWITGLWRGKGEALAQLSLPESIGSLDGYCLHPGLLDACFQVAGVTLDETASSDTVLPFMLKTLQLISSLKGQTWWCHVVQVGPYSWNIQLLDESGSVVVAIDGFEMRKAPRGAMLKRQLSDWLYSVHWQAKPLESTSLATNTAGRWLILGMNDGLSEQLTAQLKESGQSYALVTATPAISDTHAIAINPNEKMDFQRVINDLFIQSNTACRGVIYLWGLQTPSDIAQAAQDVSVAALYLVQALRSANITTPLWLITEGAQAVENEMHLQLAQAALWGFGRTLAIEQPDLSCVCLDLPPEQTAESVAILMSELNGHDGEDQIAWRSGNRYVARLARYQAPNPPALNKPDVPFRVQLANYGSPDELRLMPITRRPPKATEVEIEVKATALNFRDVLNSLGMLKDYYAEVLGIEHAEDIPLGFECAGKIVAVGADVSTLRVGDDVVAATEGSFASFVTVDAALVARKPASLSVEAAAGTPTAFLTAYYGLYELAKLQPGDKILIHAASGGVGQAAVQLAKARGAEIFATASPGKWQTLKSQGVQHVMNSRTLDFADEILAITDGVGVNVVLNSLNGDFIAKSFDVLAHNGRFVEIGKLGIWDKAQVTSLRPDAHYYPFDLGEVTHDDPALMTTMLNQVMQGFEAGYWEPLPQTVFAINDVANAYRYMQQTKHIGKVILSFDDGIGTGIRADGSYIITGGLGGLGLKVAQHLVDQGARYLTLASRSGIASEEGQSLIQALSDQGVFITVAKADVAKANDVTRLLTLAQTAVPLRGIIHAAGIIDDAMVMYQTSDHFTRVMEPKIQGAWQLHQQSLALPLDFFICFSSIASLMGSPGQTNYSAANAVVDLLMHQRRALGLPGMSINWGPWAETGMAAHLSFEDEGLDKIAPDLGIQVLADLMAQPFYQSPAQIGVFPINWSVFMRGFADGHEPPFISQIQQKKAPQPAKTAVITDILRQLQVTAVSDRLALLVTYVGNQLIQVLGLDSSQTLSPEQRWNELGLDSLMTVELKNRIDRTLRVSIPLETIMQEATTQLLAKMILDRFDDKASFVDTTSHENKGDPEDGYAKNEATLDAEVAQLRQVPQTYVTATEQKDRQILVDGQWRCDFASCNYLGMDLHPDVIASIPAAIEKWGVHPSWTRAVASPGLYAELEQSLCELLDAPETLVFPSVHLLHFGVLPLLAGFNGVIFKDNAAHHSIYEACLRAQADGTEWVEFGHNDLDDLAKKLARYRPEQSKIIAIDGVYSMSGGFPPLREIAQLAKTYNAVIYVDDAHGLGVIGENPSDEMPYGYGGRGIVKYFGLDYVADRIIYVAALSKSFSSYGAVVTCFDAAMKARLGLSSTFVFSGPSPVASLASAIAAIKVNRVEGDAKRQQVYRLTHKLVTAAKAIGYEVDNDNTFPIVSIVIGNVEQVTEACKLLWSYNLLITPAVYPVVPMHRNLARFSITASNTEAEIDQAIKGLQAVWDSIHNTSSGAIA